MPIRADRALSRPLALLGHDYFEVTFLYNENGNAANYKIARAAWELGEPAGVSDVYGTSVSAPGINYNSVGIPANGQGSAVLFVGKKFDKTLLAVGVLSHIDGVAVATNPNISSNTKKVSFELNAIRAGIIAGNVAESSFKTTPAQTAIESIKIGDRWFPFFNVHRGLGGTPANVTASYEFRTASAVHPFSFYSPAIRLAGAVYTENIRPKYIQPPDIVKDNFEYSYNSGIVFNVTAPTAIGSAFTGTVNFSFSTGAMSEAVCALIFRVPVYAVADGGVDWYVRPDYNQYFRDLDGSAEGNGGAVLIGVDIEGVVFRGLFVDDSAGKNYIGNTPADYTFSLEGIIINFIDSSSILNLLGNPPETNHWNLYPTLKFYWDSNGDNIADTLMGSGFEFPHVGRLIAIRVEYTDPGNVVWIARMEVEVYDETNYITIPENRRFVVTKQNDFSEITNGATANSAYLIVLAESVDIQMSFNAGNLTIFIVATRKNLELGRNNGTAQINFAGGAASRVYLGKWPFNEPAFAGGNVIVNEFFSVNTEGVANGGFVAQTGNMFTGNVTVEALTGITIRGNRLGP
jgi:hypothetical protein